MANFEFGLISRTIKISIALGCYFELAVAKNGFQIYTQMMEFINIIVMLKEFSHTFDFVITEELIMHFEYFAIMGRIEFR